MGLITDVRSPAFFHGTGLENRSFLFAGHSRKLQSVWPLGESPLPPAGSMRPEWGGGLVGSTPSCSGWDGSGVRLERMLFCDHLVVLLIDCTYS